MFYELVIPIAVEKSDEFTFEEMYSLLISASRPMVTKRVLKKGMIEAGLLVLPKLEQLKSTYPQIEYEKTLFRYSLLLKKFVYKPEQTL